VSEPVIIPRADHPISRRDIDPDALRVLQRLQQHGHVAYLVGGSVRDLLLGRRPKDFDIGTDAHPNQIKRLFRNCWIIGRRFRLAHIKFGTKTIEVATFRKNIAGEPDPAAPGDDPTLAAEGPESIVVAHAAPPIASIKERPIWVPADHHVSGPDPVADGSDGGRRDIRRGDRGNRAHGHELVPRDNTFGTPEEDAFRRDFTINALFYDPATKSIIDYVGGLGDLEQRVIRSIGDPRIRFVEDPVRMFRAAIFGARLGFDLDPLVIEAIAELRQLITKASSARMLEEYFKVLRSGFAEASFRALGRTRLLEHITPELKSPPDAFWDSLAAVDRYRQRFPSAPASLTNAVLMGALLHPMGLLNRPMPDRGSREEEHPERVSFGTLPVARKDLDRMRQVLQTVPRLSDPALPPRVSRGLPQRPSFPDSLTWFEVFGGDAATVEHWKAQHAARPHSHGHGQPRHAPADHGHRRHAQPHVPGAPHQTAHGDDAGRPRRRRRRRRRGPRAPQP
jgi:tRNA nucleotidyltransferase/poly(A) polymerase